jgi:hypothetical protein
MLVFIAPPHFALAVANSSMNARISSARQAVTFSASLTGFGALPVLHQRQQVADDTGMIAGISWACRI